MQHAHEPGALDVPDRDTSKRMLAELRRLDDAESRIRALEQGLEDRRPVALDRDDDDRRAQAMDDLAELADVADDLGVDVGVECAAVRHETDQLERRAANRLQ